MAIYLAPMEGLVDPVMRDVLTRIGGIDRSVTEFVRISDRVLPRRVYLRLAPELNHSSRTAAGVTVYVQLLGCDPQLLADSAIKLVELGAAGIDLNFGCPAKTVNRNQGGAILLREPKRIEQIVDRVRCAIGQQVPLSAKMRLGYEDCSLALDNARAIEDGGADELCVHARTKVEGYRPPAHWHWLDRIRREVALPVVANGDIWSLQDYLACRQASGCERVMLGRGLVSRPDLALQIKCQQKGEAYQQLGWDGLIPWIENYYLQLHEIAPRYADGRLKQWLGLLRRNYAEADQLLQQVRRITGCDSLLDALHNSVSVSDSSALDCA